MVSSMNMKFQLLKKIKMLKNTCCLKFSYVRFIMLINVKLSTTVDIFTFMSMINFMLYWVEYEESFLT